MKPCQDDRQMEIEENMKEQLGSATPKLQPSPERSDLGGITINGGFVVIGGGNITINNLLPKPPAITIMRVSSYTYISIGINACWIHCLKKSDIAQFFKKLIRQITRKTQAATQKIRQISRNAKFKPNPPQTQPSRHIQPNPTKSINTPYIPLVHI